MFESVGKKGRTKPLSPLRWGLSALLGAVLVSTLWMSFMALDSAPKAVAEEEVKPEEITFTQVKLPPPPPPPPPPAPVPKSTTKPKKNTISKKVKKQEIKPPDPTPPPPEDAPTPEPEPDFDLADFAGVPGGVPGGVIGGVVGGTVGNAPSGGTVKEVDFGDVTIVKRAPMHYPAVAKRNKITGTVIVEVTCAPDGHVLDVKWISGNKIFEDAVLSAIKNYRYAPQPITFRFRQPVTFNLK